MTDYISDFIAAMQRAGLDPATAPVADDKINRIKVNGEKRSSVTYRLMIDGDGAYGWFQSFKDCVLHKYHSRSSTQALSPEQAEELRRKREAARKRRDREIKEAQEEAAKLARELWATLKPADGKYAYSTAKGITPLGARFFPGGKVAFFDDPLPPCLVVPVYSATGICNLQFIIGKAKLFMPGGELKGCYGVVKRGEVADWLWIAEGYATACTVSEATGQTVVVAFSAGNIKAVADAMSEKYPAAEICIAADNDHETEAAGKGNDGIAKAKESGYKYSAPPPLPGASDWNDYAAIHGIDRTRETLLAGLGNGGEASTVFQTNATPVTVTPSDDWMQMLTYTSKGGLEKNNLKNVALFMANHEKFKGLFWYDEFFRQIMAKHKNSVVPISDEFAVDMMILCESLGLNKNFDIVNKMIIKVAKDRPRNPAREYFEHLKWDGVERLDKWLSYYFGAEDEPQEYLAFIGKKWLTAAVKRIYQPGCKFDHILVIEGQTGLGKSTALKTLATFGDETRCYCTDSFSFADIGNKDGISKTNGKIIIELAEMVGHNRKETEEIKAWITKQWDEARPAYARHNQIFQRMFVIACTTENQEYLNDPKGNRRYWPFLAKAIDIEALERDRVQLWAEAVHCYKSGLYIGPTPEEYEIAKAEQEKRLDYDPWESSVKSALVELGGLPFSTGDVMGAMGIALRDKDRSAKARVAACLMGMGYKNKVTWSAEKQRSVRMWSK